MDLVEAVFNANANTVLEGFGQADDSEWDCVVGMLSARG